ncbi:hypothetical protein DY251_07365 [Mesorhizobium denitrificans]|uniref:Uncharacterized protein n=2 Tax=Mesorhizobium denitrificans TaxID=2294114 RepID=A0A371XFT6_9HYPH|nr:hypothetical protein DY251_07365 [Mesorhizobium denitrificans]
MIPLAVVVAGIFALLILSGLLYFKLEDGYPQWLMAIAALVSVGVSLWAIYLLSETLKATRDAVDSANQTVELTRDIGQAQVRAYLGIVAVAAFECHLHGDLSFQLRIDNTGLSPARNVQHRSATLVAHDVPDKSDFAFGSLSEMELAAQQNVNLYVPVDIAAEGRQAVQEERQSIFIACEVEYFDVFNQQHQIYWLGRYTVVGRAALVDGQPQLHWGVTPVFGSLRST